MTKVSSTVSIPVGSLATLFGESDDPATEEAKSEFKDAFTKVSQALHNQGLEEFASICQHATKTGRGYTLKPTEIPNKHTGLKHYVIYCTPKDSNSRLSGSECHEVAVRSYFSVEDDSKKHGTWIGERYQGEPLFRKEVGLPNSLGQFRAKDLDFALSEVRGCVIDDFKGKGMATRSCDLAIDSNGTDGKSDKGVLDLRVHFITILPDQETAQIEVSYFNKAGWCYTQFGRSFSGQGLSFDHGRGSNSQIAASWGRNVMHVKLI